MEQAQRVKRLPAYLFARIEKKIQEARERGVDIISLGIGDPDLPSPQSVIAVLAEEARNPENHRYPTSEGMVAFRQEVAVWYNHRFGIELDPAREVVALIGSKEGIAHISLCYLDPGDISLVPDPGYPVYGIGTLLAGGEQYLMPLEEENGFLPDLAAIPSDVAMRAKLLFLNYPNNPTGAMASVRFFQEVVEFARSYDLLVCHDSAYSEITFEGARAPSFLEVEGARDVGVEFGSLSKPFNMTGWRIGWLVGQGDAVQTLARLKTNIDSGVFQAVQLAAVAALRDEKGFTVRQCQVYQERRDLLIRGLNSMGWKLKPPAGSFYVWAPVPEGYTSEEFAELVLERCGVVITPGNGYGRYGEGYFRMALTIEKERIGEAVSRLKEALGHVTV